MVRPLSRCGRPSGGNSMSEGTKDDDEASTAF